MKEIGKLIELLNEYETPRSGVVYKSYDNYDGFFYGVDIDGETEIAWSDSFICGKKFGWVEWLVDNDKIEASEIMLDDRMGTIYDKTDSTLMMLAIQDNPIEYLLSLIK